ncbi:MAG TPA: hypothetical protein VLZ83_16905 [Edaphocola sp.]|nr:hypothetical protein [Edaphocola sp.]
MKIVRLVLLVVLLPLLSFAQKIDIAKDGTVSVDGKKEFIIEGKMGMIATSITVSNLDGELLMSGDGPNDLNAMVVTFPGSNASFDYPLTIGLKKMFAKELVRMKVIQNGQLTREGIKRLIAKHNGRIDRDLILTDRNTQNVIVVQNPQGGNAVATDNRAALVQRNRAANIFINGGKITQDFKAIGSISSKQEASSGTVMTHFYIVDNNNVIIANASKAMNSTEIRITTFDNKSIISNALNNNQNDFAIQELIVKTLITNGYL